MTRQRSLSRLLRPSLLISLQVIHLSSSASVPIWILNRKARSSSSSVRIGTSLHGNLLTCRVYREDSLSTLLILIQSISRSDSFFSDSTKKDEKLLERRSHGSWRPDSSLKFFTRSG